MKLYYTINSPYARIVRIALLETGLGEGVQMHLLARDNLYSANSDVLAVNPTGKVPTLVLDNGVALTECKPILDYIQAVTGKALTIRDGSDGWRDLAKVGRHFALLDSAVAWLRAGMTHGQEAIVARETQRIERILQSVMADLHAMPAADMSLSHIVLATALGLEARMPQWQWRSGRPLLATWFDQIASRPSLRATAPEPL
jgi:glutathione S-transferase